MKILPPSQINNLTILEDVLEELRLNIVDHIQSIAEVLDLYSLNAEDLKRKLNLLGFSSIRIGKFISIDINSDEFEFISPEFYKMYRKLNQHRGNKMSMDYIFHSAGMMNTLVHSNTQFYAQDDIFGNVASFFDFNTYRDNQYPEIGIGDGYIIVPYSSNKLQTLKSYLAKNPIIFKFLPAGYTFIFLSDYRNGYSTGVLQYDNLLDYKDYYDYTSLSTYYSNNPDLADKGGFYPLQPYWEVPSSFENEEDIILDNGGTFSYTHILHYYDPFLWRDSGSKVIEIEYPRYTSDDLYDIPLIREIEGHQILFRTLQEYLDYYNLILVGNAIEEWKQGFEADLNNTLLYKDVWLGDYLLSTIQGSNRYPEYYDHVMGLKSIQAPTYSYSSLYSRGESLASQYFQREQKILSMVDTDIQENKEAIISDRRETDLFKFNFLDEYSLWLLVSANNEYTSQVLQNVLGFSSNTIRLILESVPTILLDGLDLSQAEVFYYQLIDGLIYNTIFAVKDGSGNIVLCNDGQHITHREIIDGDNNIVSNSPSIGRSNL